MGDEDFEHRLDSNYSHAAVIDLRLNHANELISEDICRRVYTFMFNKPSSIHQFNEAATIKKVYRFV